MILAEYFYVVYIKTLFAGYKSAAFLAYLSADVNGNVNENINFDKEKYDYGDNYNPDTGIYTVPYDGLYFVHAQMYGLNYAAHHFIIVDDDKVTYSIEYGQSSASQSSRTAVVLELRAGQEVAVQPTFSTGIEGNTGYMATYFGATLLYPN